MLIRTIASEPRLAEKSLRGGAEMVRQGGMDAILPVLIHEMLPGYTRLNQPELAEYLKQVMKAASVDAAVDGRWR